MSLLCRVARSFKEELMKIIRIEELQKLTQLSRTTIWRLERSGRFPRRVRLGAHSIGWVSDEILAWLASRPRGFSSQNASA